MQWERARAGKVIDFGIGIDTCTWTWRGGASAGVFAPVPALEHVEFDHTVPSGETTEAHGTVDLEHPLFL